MLGNGAKDSDDIAARELVSDTRLPSIP